jgi:hypothetical protein
MKKFITLLFSVVFLFSHFSSAWGQEKPALNAQPKPGTSPFSIFVEGNYFAPKLTEVNAVYQSIEKNFQLPAGNDFKSYYFILTGIRYSPTNNHSILGEFGGSMFKLTKGNSTNYMQLYYTGGSYILSLPLPMVSLYGGAGLGYLWLNTERTYSSRIGVADVNAQLMQMHGILGLEFFNPSGASFSLEGRYTYATTVQPKRADLDFTMKGIAAGIRIAVPIVL